MRTSLGRSAPGQTGSTLLRGRFGKEKTICLAASTHSQIDAEATVNHVITNPLTISVRNVKGRTPLRMRPSDRVSSVIAWLFFFRFVRFLATLFSVSGTSLIYPF